MEYLVNIPITERGASEVSILESETDYGAKHYADVGYIQEEL